MQGQAEKAEQRGGGWRGSWARKAMWGGAALMLLPPAAMQIAGEGAWSAGDFAFAALVLFGSAGLAELVIRASTSLAYRSGAAVAIGAAVLTVVANGAVGMIGSEDNSYNLWFLGVIALALAGAAAARFRARGMAFAMAAAGIAQAVFGAVGMASDLSGGIVAAAFGAFWFLAAALFHRASRETVRRSA